MTISEWVTLFELKDVINYGIKRGYAIRTTEEVKMIVNNLILENFIEADYTDIDNPRYKLAEFKDNSHLDRIKELLTKKETVTINKIKRVLELKKELEESR